jgi:hypothetical protein
MLFAGVESVANNGEEEKGYKNKFLH